MLGAIIIGAELVCAGATTCVCRRHHYWRLYVRRRCDLESTWNVPRRHRSWRRGTRPVNDAYLGAKIYGAEVRAYK
jgi:hypothetical protein